MMYERIIIAFMLVFWTEQIIENVRRERVQNPYIPRWAHNIWCVICALFIGAALVAALAIEGLI